jgi:Homeodomain-like domain
MILLSYQGWTAAAIAGLLDCDSATVRRWNPPLQHPRH